MLSGKATGTAALPSRPEGEAHQPGTHLWPAPSSAGRERVHVHAGHRMASLESSHPARGRSPRTLAPSRAQPAAPMCLWGDCVFFSLREGVRWVQGGGAGEGSGAGGCRPLSFTGHGSAAAAL